MSEKHIQRSNKMLIVILAVVLFSVLMGNTLQWIFSGLPAIYSAGPIGLSVIIFVVSLIIYFVKKTTRHLSYFVLIGSGILFTIILFMRADSYPYWIPILLAFLLFFDVKGSLI
jgi:hypothetical protein